ncbi:hypothetical protein [Nostoc sp. UCD121]|nr:hypothetical protein [Nostoc sp. UCD121]
MMDTEYVALAAQSYDPNLKCKLEIFTPLFGAVSQRSGVSPQHN